MSVKRNEEIMQMRKNSHRHQLQSTVKIAKLFFHPLTAKLYFVTRCLQFNELLMVVVQKSSRLFFMLDFVLLLVVSVAA